MLDWMVSFCYNITNTWLGDYRAAVIDCVTITAFVAAMYMLYVLCFVPMNRIRKVRVLIIKTSPKTGGLEGLQNDNKSSTFEFN